MLQKIAELDENNTARILLALARTPSGEVPRRPDNDFVQLHSGFGQYTSMRSIIKQTESPADSRPAPDRASLDRWPTLPAGSPRGTTPRASVRSPAPPFPDARTLLR